jgi:hypothetical protein
MTPSDAIQPDWSQFIKVQNWKNYIDDEVRAMWDTFTDVQKQALARQAQSQADREDWE